MRKSIPVILLCANLLAIPALAGPIAKSQVAKTANWVVHIDNDLFKSTQLGKLVRAELTTLGVDKKLEELTAILSFNPLEDIRDVTLYGTGTDQDKAVVILDGKFDSEKIATLLSFNPHYEQTPYNGTTIHRWIDEKKDPDTAKPTYGCFVGPDIAVISSGLQTVQNAVDVLKGDLPNAKTGVFEQAELEARGGFLQVAANQVGDMAAQQQQTALLKQAKEIGFVIGEADGDFYIDLGLTAISEEGAINIKKLIDGILAFASLSGDDRPRLADLATKVQATRIEDTIRIRFLTSSVSLMDMIKEQWEKNEVDKIVP